MHELAICQALMSQVETIAHDNHAVRVTSITVGGPAAGKVSTTLKRFENGGRTAVIDIITSFAALDQVTITGLQFEDFARPAAADHAPRVATSGTSNKTDLFIAPRKHK